MSDDTSSPKLAESLDFRLRFGGDWSEEDLASLRRSLKTDPRTKLLILRHLEFTPRYAALYCAEEAMLGMLLEEFPDCAAARYLLHRGAFVEFGHKGDTGETCHRLMDRHDPDHPHFRQIVIRSARASTVLFGYADISPEELAKDMAVADGHRVARWALHDSALIPLLVACGTAFKHGSAETSIPLASQTHSSLEPFDLGHLAELVAQLTEAIVDFADPVIRSKQAALACQGERLDDRGRVESYFPDNLSQGDFPMLMQVADDPTNSFAPFAISRLVKSANSRPDLIPWIACRFRSEAGFSNWSRTILSYCEDRALITDALERVLSCSGPNKYWWATRALERLLSDPWRLPPDEGVALIDRVLQLPDTGDGEWSAWKIFIETYPEQAANRRDLLKRLHDLPARQRGQLMECMFRCNVFRDEVTEEVRRLVEESLGETPVDRIPDPCREMIHGGLVRLPVVFDLLMKVAREAPAASSDKALAIQTLAKHWKENARVKELLFDFAAGSDWAPRESALKELARSYHADPEIADHLRRLPPTPDSFTLGLVHEWLDDRQLEAWQQQAEQRRLELWSKLDDPDGYPEDSLHSLAFWFGDHEETLPLLIARLHGPTEEPAWGKYLSSAQERERSWWEKERSIRAACLQTLALRWREDPRVLPRIKDAMNHPWLKVREAAARALTRAYPLDPDIPALLVPHIGESHWIFAEYTALMTGRPEGMAAALSVLEDLEDSPATRYLALDGPLYLVRYFGPLKSLNEQLLALAACAKSDVLAKAILAMVSRFFPSGGRESKDPLMVLRFARTRRFRPSPQE
jgi:hypothetical protein